MVDIQGHPTIKQLIEDKKQETGWSYADMAVATGDTASRSAIYDLVNKPMKSWPKSPDTIIGLSRMLGVPEDTIVLAYAAGLGIPVRRQPSLLSLQIPREADLLTTAERTHIIGIINGMVSGRGDLDGTPPPRRTGRAGSDAAETAALESKVDDAARALADRISDRGARGARKSG